MEVTEEFHAAVALTSGNGPSIPIEQGAEWAPEPVSTLRNGAKFLAFARNRNPGIPTEQCRSWYRKM
jgi:hypothetical protein